MKRGNRKKKMKCSSNRPGNSRLENKFVQLMKILTLKVSYFNYGTQRDNLYEKTTLPSGDDGLDLRGFV